MENQDHYLDENDRMTWTLINKQLKMIEVWIEDTSFISIFKDFQRSLIIRAYDRVGWTTNINRTPAQKGLQVELLQMACRLRYRDCTKQALIKYNEWIRNKTRPSPELMGVVLDEGVRQGSQTAWEKALEGYLEAKNPTERYQLIGALAATTDSALISRLLRLTLDGSTIRANVLPRVLSALSQNEIARAQTWHFFRVHYHNFTKIAIYIFIFLTLIQIYEKIIVQLFLFTLDYSLGDGSTLLISSIRSMVERMSTEQDLKELKAFLTDKKLQSNQPKLDQIFEQIELNIQWRRLNEESIKEWLEKWDDRRRSTYRIRRHSNRHL
uniref:ERAP1_C domain-containing protein n=1 Tax=Heterorhabditis bacteriophora TaxID=37862 RepID=A0A1I7WTV7_HETBA